MSLSISADAMTGCCGLEMAFGFPVEEFIQKYGWKGAKKPKAESKAVRAPKRRGLKKAARKSA